MTGNWKSVAILAALLAASPLATAANKEHECKASNDRVLLREAAIADMAQGGKKQCMRIRETIGDQSKAVVIKNVNFVQAMATVCPVILDSRHHDSGCSASEFLEQGDRVHVTYAGKYQNAHTFLLTVHRDTGELVVAGVPLYPEMASGGVAWLKGDNATHRFFVYLQGDFDNKNLRKHVRVEIFDKTNTIPDVRCPTHQPSISSSEQACDSFALVLGVDPKVRVIQGNTGSGSEPPPTPK